MPEPETIHPLPHQRPPRRATLPPETGPPAPATTGWDVARDAVRATDRAWSDHRERARDRPLRPPASTLSIVNTVLLGVVVFVGVALVIGHQMGAAGYEQRQVQRHEELMRASDAQRNAIYDLADVVAGHHPEASRVATELQRNSAR